MVSARLLPYCASVCRVRASIAGVCLPLERKELTRCRISGALSPLTLSVPVEGGNRSLRQFDGRDMADMDCRGIVLSEHGNWRHVHTGAFEAAYRSTPFYPHYRDALLHSIATARTLDELLQGTTNVIRAAVRQADVSFLMEKIRENPVRYRVLCEERRAGVNASLSVFDLLFRLGPEAIFALVPAL